MRIYQEVVVVLHSECNRSFVETFIICQKTIPRVDRLDWQETRTILNIRSTDLTSADNTKRTHTSSWKIPLCALRSDKQTETCLPGTAEYFCPQLGYPVQKANKKRPRNLRSIPRVKRFIIALGQLDYKNTRCPSRVEVDQAVE